MRNPTSNSGVSGSNRRSFLTRSAVTLGTASALSAAAIQSGRAEDKPQASLSKLITPPEGKRILLSCKLSMIKGDIDGKPITLAQRLGLAKQAGFDGVDFDEAGRFTVEEARAAVQESGVFCHNAINHDHWNKRLTSANEEDRKRVSQILPIAFALPMRSVAAVC
jgi:L-ribulose-5-phosphate 3-epimerase